MAASTFYDNRGNQITPVMVSQSNSVADSSKTKAYSTPNQITLRASNSSGALANFKLQSADAVVENIRGNLGAGGSFTVDELPNVAALEIGGGTLYGYNSLRRFLQTYALWFDYINYTGGTEAQLNNSINVYRANIDGTSTSIVLSVSTDVSNMQYNAKLIRISGPILYAANTEIQLAIENGTSAILACKIAKVMPYNTLL